MRTIAALVWGLALAALLGGAGRAAAQGAGLKVQMAEAAKKIADTVGDNPVKVGDFTGPAKLQATGGPGIAKELTGALKKKKVKVQDNAVLTIDGDFTNFTDPQTNQLAVRVNIRLRGRSGDALLAFSQQIFAKDAKDTSLQDLLGVSVSLPDTNDADRNAQIQRALRDPAVFIDAARVSAKKGSDYGIEIWVKDGDTYAPRTPENISGRAFVRLKRDDVYAVRLINKSKFDAAVTLTIDGTNVFAFSDVKDATGDPKITQWIVRANSGATIKGWYKTNKEMKAFVVTDLKNSAGGEIKSSGSVGTITASFALAVPRGKALPAGQAQSRDIDATGLGGSTEGNFGEGERVFGPVRETISVRYIR